MKKKLISLFTIIFIIALVQTGFAEKAPQKIVDLAQTVLVKHGMDPIIVKAVIAENAKAKSLDQIKQHDKKWKDTPGLATFMKKMMDSEEGKYIKTIQDSTGFYAEIFIMDNQGANVAMTDKTSDYWQGDEAKFQKSFVGGTGAVFVDEVEFDDSSQAYLVQVSVPVMDGGKAIGAITFGIDVDKVE